MLRFLADHFGLTVPIIQAPMAGTSTPALAAAVCEAGGLGSISIGASDVIAARKLIQQARGKTSKPFNVNVFCHRRPEQDAVVEAEWLIALRPAFESVGGLPPERLCEIYSTFSGNDAVLEMLLEERPAVVSFHFGLPSPAFIEALKSAGIFLLTTATDLATAKVASDAGVDAIVAQGYEAGGHRGVFDRDAEDSRLETLPLVRELVHSMNLPIIAAGGIMNGSDMAAALAAGAVAVQMGTAFIGCPESSADEGYRAALFSDAAHHTVMTRVISGRPARCLGNAFTALEVELPHRVPEYPLAYDAGKSLNAAAKAVGNTCFGAHWAGRGAPRARALPAANLIAQLKIELDAALAACGSD